jgi:hypothetical protein
MAIYSTNRVQNSPIEKFIAGEYFRYFIVKDLQTEATFYVCKRS